MGDAAAGFEREYAAPLLSARSDERERRREQAEGQALATPGEPFALRGCLLTPNVQIEDGWLVITDGTITEVRDTAPAGVRTVETSGVVLPGLIDLHGHPEYNVFAAWEPPRRYDNRYQWRRSAEYRAVIRDPYARLTTTPDGGALDPGTSDAGASDAGASDAGASDAGASSTGTGRGLLRELTRYAEARALVGGTTAIQGASGRYPDPHESLVRNVDRVIFGEHRARSVIDLSRVSEADGQRLRGQIDSGAVRAVYIHLAEGVDAASRAEFDDLVAADLLTPATVIIHGTALTAEQLARVADAGGKLVWSPQSNLRLYGATTAAAAALQAGVTVGLGADWLPSGSPSLLDELRIAARLLCAAGAAVPPARLVAMVTSGAARIAGIEAHVGRLAAGLAADVVVLERLRPDPWDSVLAADRSAVELVVLGGDIAYGRRDWVEELAGPTEREPVLAWGKPMALDLTYSVLASQAPLPRLADIRAALLTRYPQTGPIFA
jgi:5-methylthioadenosine/S-adenosylhomocysteine deaminase